MTSSDKIDLIPIGGGWCAWSEIWLRSAGFPAHLALELAFDPGLPFEEERLRVSTRLRELARDPLFREALAWQNRSMLDGPLRSLLKRSPEAQDSKTREYERVLTGYLHRYCAKNDTIGFFGPVAWAQLSKDEPSAVILETGESLLSQRNAYFEHWSIDAVAQLLSRDPELRPDLAPRLHPAVRLEGALLHRSDDSRTELPAAFARILDGCDGITPARRIAAEICEGDPSLDAEEIFDALEQLVDKRVLIWGLEIPVDAQHPDRALRAELLLLPESDARNRALAQVEELTRALERVAESAGSERLVGAIEELERTYAEQTGASPFRKPGETYAGRTAIFEDCVRDLDCTFGRPFIERLRPLELVLKSARWFSHQIAQRYSEAFRAEFEGEVDYRVFWGRIERHFSAGDRDAAPIVAGVRDELQRRWSALLQVDEGSGSQVVRTFEELAPKIDEVFAAPHPGWPMARFHSPDLLIDAASVEAIQAGEFQLVLGELHAASSSIFSKVGVFQHSHPEALYRRAALDLAGPSLAPAESKQHGTRAGILPLRPQDLHLETGASRAPAPRDRTIAVSELVVFEREGRLRVRTRDQRLDLDLLEALQQYLTFASVSHFNLQGDAPHRPRVVLDRIVLARESWTLPASELPFLEGNLRERFTRAQTWRYQLGLPRFVFIRLPTETKPFLVDFEDPITVDVFGRRVRKAACTFSVSEMLPSFDKLWLVDARGRRYSSELRLALVDPETPSLIFKSSHDHH